MNQAWDWELTPRSSARIDGRELWNYRHLLYNLIKKDFLLVNQQTILGPLWTLFQPLLTLFIYVLIFSRLVGISTGTLPPVLFYYSGIILWNLFSDSFSGAAGSIKDNQHIFSKVYLPRLIFPIAIGFTQLLRFAVQFILLLILGFYFQMTGAFAFTASLGLLGFVPAAILVGCFGLALGLLASIVAARYRDLFHVLSVVIRLMMFATPVIYPLQKIDANLRWIIELNPLTSFFEWFRQALFGQGSFSIATLLAAAIFTLILLWIAIRQFVARSNKLLDTI